VDKRGGRRAWIVAGAAVAAACALLAPTLLSGGAPSAAGPAAESATPAPRAHAVVRPHARVISGRTYRGSAGKARVIIRAPTTAHTPARPPDSEGREAEPHHRLTPQGQARRLRNVNSAALGAAAVPIYVNKHKDLGCAGAPGYCSLVNEPSVATNGSGSVLETWNWWAARSNNNGSSFSYMDPYSTFPASYGGFCCDQLAYYEPSRDLFIWVLQYSTSATGDNAIRIAVANGAAGLAANSWHYWDLTTAQVGSPQDWFDQPKIGTSANYAYIEVSKYMKVTNDGDGSVLYRIPLDTLKNPAATLTYNWYQASTFSPGPVQRAASTMYFGSHLTTTRLRLYVWPESTTAVSFVDVPNSNYPQFFPYSCPRTGHAPASPSDWCPRASGTGGYAHDDRINSGWLANGVIGFAWDASQGSVAGGVRPSFKYPYVHVLRINEATKTRLNDPIIYSPKYAVQWPSLAANSAGDVGGSVMWGGGAFEENCGAVVHDSRSGPGFWEFHRLGSSSADTNQAKSGDYTTSRGVGNGWVSACYTVGRGGGTGSVHTQYFAWSRTSDSLKPPCVVPNVVGKTLAKARAKLKSRACRVGKINRVKSIKRKRGRVIRQKPAPDTQLGHNGKVSLWLGR
jgi:PASTA domain